MDNPNSNCVPRVCFIETVDKSVCKPNPCKNAGHAKGSRTITTKRFTYRRTSVLVLQVGLAISAKVSQFSKKKLHRFF